MVSELTEGPTTRVRNQTAGYITRQYALSKAQSSGGGDDEEEDAEEE
jgi:ribosomal protein S17E